ncbi:MAG: cohesin domain-containing protein [bacterium]|nr:cohesin domain-containing protein [bacterium]
MIIFNKTWWMADRVKTFVIGVIAFVLAVELGTGLWMLFGPSAPRIVQTPTTTSGASSASLLLTPSQVAVRRGEEVSLDILLDAPGQKIGGVDAVLKYDPAVLTFVPAAPPVATDSAQTTFDVYPQNAVSVADGTVTFSGITQGGVTVGPSSRIGKVMFRVNANAPKVNETAVWFVFGEGRSDDSNILDASSGNDILSSVGNAIIQLK